MKHSVRAGIGQVSDKDIRHLRIFKSVVEAGGFAAAETLLGTGRSTISIQIRALEDRLGDRLCQRGRQGFELTPFGEVVYQSALELFDHLDLFREKVRKGLASLSGELRLGLADNTIDDSTSPLVPALEQFGKKLPEVNVSLLVDSSFEIEKKLKEDLLDIAIVPMHKKTSGFNYVSLYQEKLRLYCSDKHPLFDQGKTSLEKLDLKAYRFVTTRYLSSFGHWVPVHGEALAQNMEAVTLLLLSGHYLGYLPEHLANRFVQQGRLKVIDLEEYVMNLQFAVLTRKEAQSAIQKAFLEELFQCVGNKQ